jgi:hypothetical protein
MLDWFIYPRNSPFWPCPFDRLSACISPTLTGCISVQFAQILLKLAKISGTLHVDLSTLLPAILNQHKSVFFASEMVWVIWIAEKV